MKYKLIFLGIGVLLMIEALFLFLSSIVSLLYKSNDLQSLLMSGFITFSVGGILYLLFRKTEQKASNREAFIIVSLCWFVLSFFGALPFVFSEMNVSLVDSFFETMSGLTTTGATVFNNIESFPKGLLFWRSILQWLGGMGIIVLSMALISFVKTGGLQLFNAEAPILSTEKIHPRINIMARILWLMYLGLTVIQTILLYFGGMSIFDAVCHSLTTISSGGFSTKQNNIAAFQSGYIQYVIIIFMFIAGTNFNLIYFGITGQFRKILKNTEFKFYTLIIVLFTILIGFGLYCYMSFSIEKSFRNSLFQVVSILTTTGFASSDYLKWTPTVLSTLLLVLMFIGASTGSTSGGIKAIRVHILFRNIFVEFKRIIHPRAVLPLRYNKHSVSQQIINNIMAFIALYLITILFGTIVMQFAGMDIMSAFGTVVASLGNIGTGTGSVGPIDTFSHINNFGKIFLSFLMMLGRLELFTVLIIFTKTFWKK